MQSGASVFYTQPDKFFCTQNDLILCTMGASSASLTEVFVLSLPVSVLHVCMLKHGICM